MLAALRRGAIRATCVVAGGVSLSEEYPVFTREEISKRDGKRGATWVTYKDQVYDITEFVNAHPGGAQKIKLAAGASVSGGRRRGQVRVPERPPRRPRLCGGDPTFDDLVFD